VAAAEVKLVESVDQRLYSNGLPAPLLRRAGAFDGHGGAVILSGATYRHGDVDAMHRSTESSRAESTATRSTAALRYLMISPLRSMTHPRLFD
jgi:hypothetical protein